MVNFCLNKAFTERTEMIEQNRIFIWKNLEMLLLTTLHIKTLTAHSHTCKQYRTESAVQFIMKEMMCAVTASVFLT